MRFVAPLAALLAALLALAAGCGNGDDNPPCTDTNGSWAINGCFATSCAIAQNGCSITLSCQTIAGPATFTGAVSGAGMSFANNSTSCHATIDTATAQAAGSCTTPAGTCDFTARRR